MMSRIFLILFSAFLVFGCSDDVETPEDRIAQLLNKAEEAVESKDLDTIRDIVSEDYRDSRNQDYKAVINLVRFYFLRHQSVHLFTKIDSIEIAKDNTAKSVVFVAMAGSPIADGQNFAAIRADFHRFEIDLHLEDDEWRLIGAQWRRATKEDFID